jgi:CDP-paratose 2-epimerase
VFGSPEYVVRMNPVGACHCFELARRDGAQLVSLSTSRVDPYGALGALPHTETATRFELTDRDGIAEDFPLEGPRTCYGSSKLGGGLLLGEYELP